MQVRGLVGSSPGEKDDACLSSKQADSSGDMQPESADSKESTDFWWLGQPHPKVKVLFPRQARAGNDQQLDTVNLCY